MYVKETIFNFFVIVFNYGLSKWNFFSATASSDENLCIWDFFGTSTQMEKKYLNMNKRVLTMDMFQTVEMFGSKIR